VVVFTRTNLMLTLYLQISHISNYKQNILIFCEYWNYTSLFSRHLSEQIFIQPKRFTTPVESALQRALCDESRTRRGHCWQHHPISVAAVSLSFSSRPRLRIRCPTRRADDHLDSPKFGRTPRRPLPTTTRTTRAHNHTTLQKQPSPTNLSYPFSCTTPLLSFNNTTLPSASSTHNTATGTT
jgi:hypothetical protein